MTHSTEQDNVPPTDKAIVDEALKDATPVSASDALKRNILADFDEHTREGRKQRTGAGFGFGVLFEHVRLASFGAVAGLSALGVATGLLTANAGAALTPEEEFYQYAEGAFSLALTESNGELSWDVD